MNTVADYYHTLQAEPGSSIEELKLQYRRLAKIYHPDRNPGEEAWCEEQLKKLNEAFTFLSDPVQKAAYDQRRPRTEQPYSRPDASYAPPPPVAPINPTRTPARQQPTGYKPIWVVLLAIATACGVYRYEVTAPTSSPIFITTGSTVTHPKKHISRVRVHPHVHHTYIAYAPLQVNHRTVTRHKHERIASAHHSAPSVSATLALAERFEARGRAASATRLRHMGVSINPNAANLSQMQDYERRVRAAKR